MIRRAELRDVRIPPQCKYDIPLPLRRVPITFPETSVIYYQSTLRNIPEERRPDMQSS